MALIIAVVLILIIATSKFSDSSAKYVSDKRVKDEKEIARDFRRRFVDEDLEETLNEYALGRKESDELEEEFQKALSEIPKRKYNPDRIDIWLANRGKIKSSSAKADYGDPDNGRGSATYDPATACWLQDTLRKQGYDVTIVFDVVISTGYIKFSTWKNSFSYFFYRDYHDRFNVDGQPITEEIDASMYRPDKYVKTYREVEIPKPYYEDE